MPRPRKDGTPPKPTNRRKLTPLYVTKNKEPGLTWDTEQKGLVLCTQPTGHRAFKCIYSHHGRPRWLHLADANAIGLAQARKLARGVMHAVAEGKDPQAEKKAERLAGSLEELAGKYIEDYAKKKNKKSWEQAAALVQRYVLPSLGKLPPANIARSDIKAMLRSLDERPVLANAVLASTSAIFSWAVREEIVKDNPCRLIERHKTQSRERILSDSEIPLFWAAFDEHGLEGTALKLILLLGQRPGEVCNMRREHIVDGWWSMPGEPDAKLGWPGTKNGASHRVWLPTAAQKIIAQLGDATTGFVLARRGRPIGRLDDAMRAICTKLAVTDRATPHDLRRTHGSTITGLGFGREAMNRVQNHKEGGISSVYDRHQYGDENKRIMEAVAAHMMALAEGKPGDSKVVRLTRT